MNVEIINTGSELLLGKIQNSHQQWLCRRLSDLGYVVARQTSVNDSAEPIQQAVREALGRAEVLITTGGLGPTSDDLTRDLIAQLLERKLLLDKTVLGQIEHIFSSRNRPMPMSTRVQAMVPEGARVLPNSRGTAPGLAIEVNPNPFSPTGQKSWLIMLPGPPRELYPMFDSQVIPLLKTEMPPPLCATCTLRIAGIGESVVEERVAPSLQPLLKKGLELGYCARTGEVDVRVMAHGLESGALVKAAEEEVRALIGAAVFATGEETMESIVVGLLRERKQTLAVAESCTGGLIAHRVTNVPGASAVLMAGLVTYSNESKQSLLGVKPSSLEENGAVSEEVAREMAEGVRERLGTDYGVSVTGIAGPTGGSAEKPVGTVFMAVARAGQTTVQRQFNLYDRETFKFVTSQQALDMLRRAILG